MSTPPTTCCSSKSQCGCSGASVTTSAPQRATNELGDPTGWLTDGTVAPALDLGQWIETNRPLMKPPVANKYVYSGQDFFVMIICGPNSRNDFHQTDSEEFFFQMKGDIVVKIRDKAGVRDIPIREGECFFIPPNVPHSPRRGPNTVGMVIERRRPPNEKEHIIYFCPNCGELVHDKAFACQDIVKHFTQAMEEFWANAELSTCRKCGTRITKPQPGTTSPGAC